MNDKVLVFPVNGLLKGNVETAGFFTMDLEGLSQDEMGNPTALPPQTRTKIEAAQRAKTKMVILAHHQQDPSISRICELLKEAEIPVPRVEIVDLKNKSDPLEEVKKAIYGEPNLGRLSPDESPQPQKLAFEPFPLECLPDAVKDFVEPLADSLGCDPSMVAVPALACLAGAIGGSRALELKTDWKEPLALWVGIVADSGSMKTPALAACLEPFWDIHNERNQVFQSKLAAFEQAQNLSKKIPQRGGPKYPNEPLDHPILERAIVGDVTIQKMAEVLNETPRGTLCAVDELSGWFGGLSRYAPSGGSDLSPWLSLHSGQALQVDRRKEKSIFVRRALASLVGGIQPGILKRHLTRDFTESGAAARFLFAMPPKRPKKWREFGVPPKAKTTWNNLIRDLLALEMVSKDGRTEPGLIPLDQKAKSKWLDFFQDHAKAQHEATGHLAAFLAKLEAMAGRLSLVLGLADRVSINREDLSPLEAIWVEAGTTLARWFQRERKRIETALAEPEPGLINLVDRIQTMLREAGANGLSRTEISEHLHRNIPAKEIQDGLNSLALQGMVKMETKTIKTGRPVETWRATGGFFRNEKTN